MYMYLTFEKDCGTVHMNSKRGFPSMSICLAQRGKGHSGICVKCLLGLASAVRAG